MTSLRFCIVFLCGFIAFAAAVAAINVAVDPYLLFNIPRIPGFNASKPLVKTRERMMKAYDAPRQASRTVILGSSRCDIGLNPSSPVWRESDRPVYNLSLPGSELAQLSLLLQHVMALNPPGRWPRTAIICLDFEFFLFRPEAASDRDSAANGRQDLVEFEERMAVLRNGQPNRWRILRAAKDYAKAMFSINTLADSAITVSANVLPETWNIASDGHLAETMFRRSMDIDGAADLFARENLDHIRRYSVRHVISDTPGGAIDKFLAVRKLIEIGRAHGMSIIFAIPPSHADVYEIFDQMGYWEEIERWKRSLAELVADERRRGAAVTLWDFAGYEAFSQERVPPSKDRNGRLEWFWDSVHCTTALGDIMLARMLGREGAVPYGIELTPDTVDERLAGIRFDRAAYRTREPGEAQRRAALFAGTNTVGRTTTELWHADTVMLQLARLWEGAAK